MRAPLIALLCLATCLTALRALPRRRLGRARTCRALGPRVTRQAAAASNTDSDTRLLYTIPTSLVKRQAVVAYVHSWASESTNVGRAIRATLTPRGVRFLFVPSPGSHLDVLVDELGDDITLSTSVVMQGGNSNVQSLIRFSAQSLVDSLANDVGTLIMTGGIQDGAKMALPRATGDVAQVIRQKARPSEPARGEAMDISSLPIPTADDVMSLWTEEQLPAQQAPAPQSGSSGGSEEVVYEWKEASEGALEQVLQHVQGWSSRFANRGAGVMSASRIDGARFGFAIGSDEAALLVRVTRSGAAVAVVAEAVAAPGDDEQTQSLVSKARANIVSALKKDLATLLIQTGAEQEEEGEEEGASLDEALQAVEAATARAVASPKVRGDDAGAAARQRDPSVVRRAAEAGVKLESFESRGLEEQAMRQLQDMISDGKRTGYLEFIKGASNSSELAVAITGSAEGLGEEQLTGLFAEGSQLSEQAWQSMLERSYDFQEDLTAPAATLPINLKAGGLAGGVDIFQDPANYRDGGGGVSTDGYVAASSQAGSARRGIEELLPPKPQELEANTNTLKMLLTELGRAPEEMHDSVLDGFKDLYLADNFLYLVRTANETMTDGAARMNFAKITKRASSVIADLGALVQQESVRHLETIHDICEISAQYQHDEEYFLERLSYIKPKFDTEFLGYLKWAVEEEKTVIRLGGGDPAALPSKWLQVLYVVQRGVIAEFETRFERLLEPLILTIRFEDRDVRRSLLREFVAVTPAIELHTLRALALNMAAGVAEAGADLRRKTLDLKDDLNECLSPDIIEQVRTCAAIHEELILLLTATLFLSTTPSSTYGRCS